MYSLGINTGTDIRYSSGTSLKEKDTAAGTDRGTGIEIDKDTDRSRLVFSSES